MKFSRCLVFSFGLAVVLWTVNAWPLPRYLFSGIASSAHNIESPSARRMIPGDHLQLMYHFQLLPDAMAGRIGWFQNPYEFNRGDDAERSYQSFYYLPFSAFYALAGLFGGRAFGWNMAGFAAVWMALLGYWRLARRFSDNEDQALAAAVVALLIPYAWSAQMGGSPTGFGMGVTPWFLLGLDIVVRDKRARGGWMAGIALLAACWSDTHTFFFIVLAAPLWCLLVMIDWSGTPAPWRAWRAWRSWLRALTPLLAFGILTLLATVFMKSDLGDSRMAGGRDPREVAIFSPHWRGFFQPSLDFIHRLLVMMGVPSNRMEVVSALLLRRIDGVSLPVFMGLALPAMLLTGWLASLAVLGTALVRRSARTSSFRHCLVGCLLFGGIVVVLVLALGPRGPWDGRLFYGFRRLIPPYAMIRQPAKILLLLPSMVAVGLVLGASALDRLCGGGRRTRRVARTAMAAGVILAGVEAVSFVRPTVCLLRDEQPAYAAVAGHAAASDHVPRVVILPLWPGDSHYGSVYEHYVSLYAIRMLNGYSPVVAQTYFEEVFLRFQSLNQGAIDDEQLDDLLGMGIDYILLHEDLFPEKVSPFPVVQTLAALWEHPRLRLLQQADRVWAFNILPRTAGDRQDSGSVEALQIAGPGVWSGVRPPADWTVWFPSRHWEVEHFTGEAGERIVDPSVSGGAYSVFDSPGAGFGLRPTGTPPVAGLRLLTRVRGSGRLAVDVYDHEAGERLQGAIVTIDSQNDWQWLTTPLELDRFYIIAPRYELVAGRLEIDSALLMAGEWPQPLPGESVSLPAPLFFRAGYTDPRSNAVVFRALDDPAGVVFYGPHLPLPAGTYELTVDFDASGPASVGSVYVQSGGYVSATQRLQPGMPTVLEVEIPANLPVRLNLDYNRAADLVVRRINLRRTR